MRRGEIFWANLDPTVGAEIKKRRPVIIVSNNANNEMAGTVTIVPTTSQNPNRVRLFEVAIPPSAGLRKNSKARADQIRTIDKRRISDPIGNLDSETLRKLNRALRIHLQV